MRKFSLWLMALLMLSVVAVAAVKKHAPEKSATPASATPVMVIEEGKQYQRIIKPSASLPVVPAGKIVVIEFFSYGCPWCYDLDTFVQKWKSTLSKDVIFMRVPVEFKASWNRFAKAYYTAEMLGVENKITPLLFHAVQDQHMSFDTDESLEAFFVKNGVAKKDFESTFHFSPGIDAALMRGRNLVRDNEISRVPCFLINGNTKTDVGMAGGPQAFFSIVDQLIAKERVAHKK